MSKRKRGRGMNRTLQRITQAKMSLDKARADINLDLSDERYQNTAEAIRKAAEFLLVHASTPQEKLEYTRDIIQLGKFFVWKGWNVGTLNPQQSRDYMIGKAMQAEEDQWKYINIIRKQQKPIRDALDQLGVTHPDDRRPNGFGLSVRIRPDTRSMQLKAYAAAKKRTAMAEIKLKKYAKAKDILQKRYETAPNRNKFEEWKNTHKAWEKAKRELQEALEDEPRKKLAWLESKSDAPAAKGFK